MATVYFYKMRLFEKEIIKKDGKDIDKYNYKDKEVLETAIKNIIVTNEEHNCIPIEDAPNWVVLEILDNGKIDYRNRKTNEGYSLEESDYIFGRLGRKKDITNMQKRNRETFESEEIKKDPKQDIEIHTYFYLFFDSNTIVYLNAQSAPSIHKLSTMFERYSSESNNEIEVTPITAKDMVEILKHKDIVNSFQITTTLPSDEVLNIDNLGLDEDTFDMMRQEKNIKFGIKISADGRTNNLFKENKSISKLVDKLLNGKRGKVNKLRFKARDKEERIQEYDIIEKKFTKSVHFKYTSNEGLKRREEIKEKLLSIYLENKNDIIRYCRG